MYTPFRPHELFSHYERFTARRSRLPSVPSVFVYEYNRGVHVLLRLVIQQSLRRVSYANAHSSIQILI